jgi:catechol 2,3-dioxygenase-like lactoylglutathione lyase family enzyme
VSARVHHSAIVVRDVEASLRFWRDGIGFQEIMDMEFDGDWVTLFDAPSPRLRSLFLGDPERADSGIVELVQFLAAGDSHDNANGAAESGDVTMAGAPTGCGAGFLLLSCYVEVDVVLERLRGLGLGGTPRRITVGPDGGVKMATVVDPDGVLVELIGIPSP